ncbi:MAG: mannosyl-3-phosphoglycerate phosphatase [Kiritimatiellia bacterium]|jgi:mannosyl-3-phosphoglycerate phosphatase
MMYSNRPANTLSNNARSIDDTQYVIFSDLDGTLLDHDSYCFDAALPALSDLEKHQIPVIINSSKTAAEISALRQKINIQHPFIVENGSAIFIPKDYPMQIFNEKSHGEHNDSDDERYDVNCDDNDNESRNENTEKFNSIILGETRKKILNIINSIVSKQHFNFTQYQRYSYEDIAKMTGLTLEEAAQSAQRHYTEPLQWLDNGANKRLFQQQIEAQDLHILQGGRFMHVMGLTDKGKASSVLAEGYQKHYKKPITTVALGDSHNDIAMLQAADIAIVIRSAHYPAPIFEHPNKMISHAYGPEGWHECIQALLFKPSIIHPR